MPGWRVMKIETLKRPSQFKRVRGGVRWAGPLFVIEGRRRAADDDRNEGRDTPGPRFGFTITRKVGGAVVRNRIRRRLKEAIRTLSSPSVRADHDYVVVASRAAHDYPFAELQVALREAFERLCQQVDSGQPRARRGKRRPAGRREAAASRTDGAREAVKPAIADEGPGMSSDGNDTTPGSTPGRR